MGKLVEKSNGVYYLEVKIAGMTVKKCFIEVELTAENIENSPKPNGFYLYIQDVIIDN